MTIVKISSRNTKREPWMTVGVCWIIQKQNLNCIIMQKLIKPTQINTSAYKTYSLGHTELRRRAMGDVDFNNFPRLGYDITILLLWSHWKRWVCDASVMSVKSYDIVRESNDSRTMTYDLTMIAWWEANIVS